ncbi:MAG: hypothetical protein JST41_06605 [Bacteroidetes bacterium]|jgi:predicted phage tail protein|nr:hypothetical protein [Bacteroidota bacterium]MCC6654055.1 hypothetical protein [Flavobacteriales bacterium]HMU14146.1 hypothetical protein [Flavobacteriales bacterium]HNI05253.1 hypothetical protein [Flavobacteriales bacterium]
MKKTLFTALCGLTLLWSCQNDPTQSEQYKHLEHEHDSVSAQSGGKDTTINNLLSAFNNVSENLRAIKEKQGVLGKPLDGQVETTPDMEKRIAADLYIIDSLLSDNKKLIERMRRNASANKSKINELEKTLQTTIANMELTIAEKDSEIAGLKEQLTSTNASLASMITMYQDKEQLATAQRAELNKAYYCVGTGKELKDNGVVTKEGGFVGIGKSTKLNTQGMNMEYFKQVDITQMLEIPVNAKKAKLITSHPANSYKMEGPDGRVDKLTIVDPNAFWSVSKYLVVQAD